MKNISYLEAIKKNYIINSHDQKLCIKNCKTI